MTEPLALVNIAIAAGAGVGPLGFSGEAGECACDTAMDGVADFVGEGAACAEAGVEVRSGFAFFSRHLCIASSIR